MHDYNAVDISHSLSMDLSFVFETYTQPHMHMPAEMHTQIRRYNYISVSMKPIAAICTARIATVILYTYLFLILLKNSFYLTIQFRFGMCSFVSCCILNEL